MLEMWDKTYNEGIEQLNKWMEENNCEILKKHDLKAEIDWTKDLIERLNSPVVFCHNDYRSSNLLFTEPNNQLVVCDFDLSGYDYRGIEFSMMMREWKNKHFFLNMKNIEGLPLGSQIKPFIEIYVDECERIHGKSFRENANNSVEHILKEAKIFLMLTYLFFSIMQMKVPPKPKEGPAPMVDTKRPSRDPKFIVVSFLN